MKLVVATGNAHKLGELEALLPGIPLVGLSALPPSPEPIEAAEDYAGNAIIKAKAPLAHGVVHVLADDSGLEVAALGGAPGVHSARYAPGSDARRREKLLAELADVSDRAARFVCCIALTGVRGGADLPAGVERRADGVVVARGEVSGRITAGPRGEGGFGYDPIFLVDGLDRTMAELSAAEKNVLSHRARACALILPLLRRIFLDDARSDR